VLSILHLTDTLIPKTEAQLQEIDPQWRTTGGPPSYYTQLTPDTFTISPTPASTTAKAMSIRVAIYPTIAASRIDSQVFNDNYNALVSGALAKLLLMGGKTWSDPNMGALYMQSYAQELERAANRSIQNRLRPKRTVSYGGI